jgi:hypothetical protein
MNLVDAMQAGVADKPRPAQRFFERIAELQSVIAQATASAE